MSCKTFRHNRNTRIRFNKPRMDMFQNSFSNAFSPLLNDFECRICNNFGHKESECRSKIIHIYSKTKNKILPRFGGRKIKKQRKLLVGSICQKSRK
jgi:hypothetical protein